MQHIDFIDNLNCMIDLHIHLDGAISLKSAKQLAKMQNIIIPTNDSELLKKIRVDENCSSLDEFLEKFTFPCSLIQNKESIVQAMTNLLNELKEQGVMYVEVRFAPQKSTDKGLTQDEVVKAALDGMKVEGIKSNLILCCMRGNDNIESNIETVFVAEKYLGKGVVAVDLAGAESLFKTSDFANIFRLAREKNIPITIHAGEAAGAENIKAALEFGATRIGHGIRCLENKEIVKELVDNNIVLELCPTSNVNTAIVKSISEWPLKELMAEGLNITINTDDPAIENTNIKNEYKKLITNFGIGKREIKKFLLNAAKASFADDIIKKEMIDKIETTMSIKEVV